MDRNSDEQKEIIERFESKINSVLENVERKRETQFVDIVVAILLSLATVGSAWCAYQSNLWNGIQTFKLMDAHQAGRLSSQKSLEAIQIRSIEAILLMEFINSSKTGDQKLADFYFSRFDPVLKKATLEWLELDPFNNKDAPNSPLKMESYKNKQEEISSDQLQLYYKEMDSANEANHTSNTYVMFTVIFASALFFAGIAGTLKSHSMRNLCIAVSGLILISTLMFLINMPVANIFR